MVKEYVFINAFRALAAYWVLAAHCMIWGGWYGVPLPSAKIAVDLFMMISGYLMMATALAKAGSEPMTERGSWYRFWLRRWFRIAPAYYLSLLVAVVGSSWFLGGYEAWRALDPERWAPHWVYDPARIEYTALNIVLHLSFLFGLHPEYAFSTFLPDWSLSLEMQFYLLFPLLYLAMRRYGALRTALVVGLTVFAIGMAIADRVRFFEPSLLFFKLQYFIAGMLIFQVVSTDAPRRSKAWWLGCGLLLVCLEQDYGDELYALPILFSVMALSGWLEANGRLPAWCLRLYGHRWVRFASDTSYGVYLFHGFFIAAAGLLVASSPWLQALTPSLRVLMVLAFVSIGSYAAGYGVFRLVETPCVRWGRRAIERVSPGAGKKVVAPLASRQRVDS